MSLVEFNQWREFYRLWPFDDYHRHYRPASVIAQSNGGDRNRILDWLQPDPRTAGMSEADMNTMRALGFNTKG